MNHDIVTIYIILYTIIDIYNSLLLLSFYWNTAHKMVCNTNNVYLEENFPMESYY